jgi:hypothetical protein
MNATGSKKWRFIIDFLSNLFHYWLLELVRSPLTGGAGPAGSYHINEWGVWHPAVL